MPMEHPQDHDTLIRIEEQLKNLTSKVEVLTDDHEKRIRSIEKYVWKAIGGLIVIDFILGVLITYYSNRH